MHQNDDKDPEQFPAVLLNVSLLVDGDKQQAELILQP